MSDETGGDGKSGMTPFQQKCLHCRFGTAITGTTIVCRRNPPTPDPSPHIMTSGDRRPGVWPVVDPDDWCGEYKPKVVTG